MASPDLSVFGKVKTKRDFDKESAEFDARKQARALQLASQEQNLKLGDIKMQQAKQDLSQPKTPFAGNSWDAQVANEVFLKNRNSGMSDVDAKRSAIDAILRSKTTSQMVTDEMGNRTLVEKPRRAIFGSGDQTMAQPTSGELQPLPMNLEDVERAIGGSPKEKNSPKPEGNFYDKQFEKSMKGAEGNPALQQKLKTDYAVKKSTFSGDQANAALYADRMAEANAIISNPVFLESMTDLKEQAKGGVPIAGNFLVSPEYRASDQAKRNFINATLRRESGAAIAPSEFENAEIQYFPRPGDDPRTIKQKEYNRQTAIMGIARGAGAAYEPPEIKQETPKRIKYNPETGEFE